MFNNKILNPLFLKYNLDFVEIIKSHKHIIIENINSYLLFKKIKEKEIPKTKK
jgi:hypothetical protein